jgi:hypothetical protein
MSSKMSLQDLLKVAAPALDAQKALGQQLALAFPMGINAFLGKHAKVLGDRTLWHKLDDIADQHAKFAKLGNMLLRPELQNLGRFVEQNRKMPEFLRNAAPALGEKDIDPLPPPTERPPFGFLTLKK